MPGKVKRKNLIIRKSLQNYNYKDEKPIFLSYFLQNTAKESIIETPTIMLQRPILFTENQIIEVRNLCFLLYIKNVFKDFFFQKVCIYPKQTYIFRQTLTVKKKTKNIKSIHLQTCQEVGYIILPTL